MQSIFGSEFAQTSFFSLFNWHTGVITKRCSINFYTLVLLDKKVGYLHKNLFVFRVNFISTGCLPTQARWNVAHVSKCHLICGVALSILSLTDCPVVMMFLALAHF